MLVEHYLELFHFYRWRIAAIALATTCLVAVGSALQLILAPVYTASADVTIIPSQAEFSFGRAAAGGPGPTTRGLTATFTEYLQSRPVVGAVLDRLSGGDAGASPVSDVQQTWLGSARGFAWRIYRTFDSGRYVAGDPRERELSRLIDAITVDTVEDSFVLRIEVNLPNPERAAAVANALAHAYVERVSQQLGTNAKHVEAFLSQETQRREAELGKLGTQEDALTRQLGIASFDSERDLVMRSRSTERQRLVDAHVELEKAENDLKRLESQDLARSGRSLAQLNEERSLAEARHQSAIREVELRQENIGNLSSALARLNDKGQPLPLLQRQRQTIIAELAELQSRKLESDLTKSIALTQLQMINPAVVPPYPSSPRVVMNSAFALVLALAAALAGIVVVDTVSGTVRTSADLERLAPNRSLGRISRSLVTRASDPSRKSERRTEIPLRNLGVCLERHSIMLKDFRAPTIQVSGMVSGADIRAVALTLASALRTQGSAACILNDDCSHPEAARGAGSPDRLAGAEEAPGPVFSLRCQPPLSTRTNLEAWARVSAAIVFVLPIGALPEQMLTALLQRSLDAGLSGVSFMLLEP